MDWDWANAALNKQVDHPTQCIRKGVIVHVEQQGRSMVPTKLVWCMVLVWYGMVWYHTTIWWYGMVHHTREAFFFDPRSNIAGGWTDVLCDRLAATKAHHIILIIFSSLVVAERAVVVVRPYHHTIPYLPTKRRIGDHVFSLPLRPRLITTFRFENGEKTTGSLTSR